MLSRVLVPMDGSEMSHRALEYALENHPGADVTVLTVVGEPSSMWGGATGLALESDLEEAAQERAESVFKEARELATTHDADVDSEVQLGNPVRAILNRAENFDAIVLGSHGGNLADRLYVGDVSTKVFQRSPVPVTVVR